MGDIVTSVIWRTTSSLLRSFPSKRGARSRASTWKNWGGIIVILSNDGTELGTELILGSGELDLMVIDLERRLVRVSESWPESVVVEMSLLGFELATRLNRRVRFISTRVEPRMRRRVNESVGICMVIIWWTEAFSLLSKTSGTICNPKHSWRIVYNSHGLECSEPSNVVSRCYVVVILVASVYDSRF